MAVRAFPVLSFLQMALVNTAQEREALIPVFKASEGAR
jgi:hypothetical protein